jgi:NhaA family Na+:H+ antiporter
MSNINLLHNRLKYKLYYSTVVIQSVFTALLWQVFSWQIISGLERWRIKVWKVIRHFLHLEAVSGILLLVAALAAVALSNSPFDFFYQKIIETPLEFHLLNSIASKPLLFWVNEGLMTIFFLLIGLELKREFLIGELSGFTKIILPGTAAVGGMLVPALIYAVINWQHSGIGLKGWAVPVATDIAFALGVLSFFGSRVPAALRLFLLALAIFDDVGAIIIIAVFHTLELSWAMILLAGVALLILGCLNQAGVRHLVPYLIVGLLLWACVLQSGVHSTVAGVLLAFFIPLGSPPSGKISPLHKLEKILHPWVTYLVLPLFAFVNAGLSLSGLAWRALIDPVILGIVSGLFVGKQVGVVGFVWLVIKLRWAKLPEQVTWLNLYGVALLCGIGFTMSLFIGTLAFENQLASYLVKVRLGVLLASIASSVVGAIVLQLAFSQRGGSQARQAN